MSGATQGHSSSSVRHDAARADADLAEALPPASITAEMSVLGSLLIEPHACGDVVQLLAGKDDFWRPSHGHLYETIVSLYDQRQSVDLVQLQEALADKGLLETVGGSEYLIQLVEGVPTAAHASHYAKIVRDKSMLRQLINATRGILQEAHDRPEDASSLLDEAERRIFEIAQKAETSRTADLKTLIRQTVERLEEGDGGMRGLSSGFGDLDGMLQGMQPGEMLILAARPSMGKTALALNIAENLAVHGDGVGVFSLEMGAEQLVQRLLCSRAGISGERMRSNSLRKDEYRALFNACGELDAAPLYIDDTPGLTLLQLRAKARRMHQKHGIKALVIDYLQLMSMGGRVESRQQEVSEISRGIKALARELHVPVVCLSQLNRGATQRENHEPRLSDLRESGAIEQDADVVLLLHREAYYHSDDEWRDEHPDLLNLAEVIVAKQRNGPTGRVKLTWESSSTRFHDYTGRTDPMSTGSSGTPWGDSGPAPVDPGAPPPAGDGWDDDLPA
ncbi:MAG: replicative DNA helicase [Phycisphaerales bacterium]|nr:replicative DNA helicase [Phycisphaerales bacterium]